MAAGDEVQESCNNSSGIKLFGATISVKERSKSSDHDHDEEESKKDDGRTVGKRPDKIIPCPRCRSMETKFCYFNNYNVNQPRHFCRGCQRYWTAGGALRNVPVGAGRRKIKPTCRGLSEYEASAGVQQLGFYRVEEHGVFGHLLPAKRRRCATDN